MDKHNAKALSSNSLDSRCSIACTRAGLAALLLAAICLSFLVAQEEIIKFNRLGKYLSLRLNLVDNLEALQEDPCWLDLQIKEGKQVERGWNLEKLRQIATAHKVLDKLRCMVGLLVGHSGQDGAA